MECLADVGGIAIGRNEGERLRSCLRSMSGRVQSLIYVDSGSSDGSRELARELGAELVDLDLSVPFTAARARNAGFARLKEVAPDVRYVQFVDGDCEVVTGWLELARERLHERSELAAVCGRRRERHPEASMYNRLCDLEWDTPVGDALACGGDAMMRAKAFADVGGFDPTLIAGEEPELCVRLRDRGWRIERVDAEMTLHDAAMTRFDQWWKRNVRAGHAFAEGAALHGKRTGHWVKETRRIWLWGVAVPLVAVGGALPTFGFSLGLLAAYPLNLARTYRRTRADGRSHDDALLYAAAVALSKLPEAQGALKYRLGRAFGQRSELIEYKGSTEK